LAALGQTTAAFKPPITDGIAHFFSLLMAADIRLILDIIVCIADRFPVSTKLPFCGCYGISQSTFTVV
jgi:hypothetical protein